MSYTVPRAHVVHPRAVVELSSVSAYQANPVQPVHAKPELTLCVSHGRPVSPQAVCEPAQASVDTKAPRRRGGRTPGLPEARQSANGTWSVRMRRSGYDIYVSGHRSKREAEKEARDRLSVIEKKGAPKGRGPERTTLAAALQAFGMSHLPRLKGAQQEARRLNVYLRHAGLETFELKKLGADSPAKGRYFEVSLAPANAPRVIPNGLGGHRKKLLTQSANSERVRAHLATKMVDQIDREDLQRLVDALEAEGKEAATVGLERAVLRRFFNFAKTHWKWHLPDNPATGLVMPVIDNEIGRALTQEEQERLEQAMATCRNKLVMPVTTLLREGAMRTGEPLEYAKWGDVDWDACVLKLQDSKTGRREVPLSPAALDALRALKPGADHEPIVQITYESLKSAWNNASKRAGIKDVRLYDLRHTGATRLMLETGNVGLVKALTGHKTMAMLERYVRINANDVVAHFRKREQEQAVEKPVAAPAQACVTDAAVSVAVDDSCGTTPTTVMPPLTETTATPVAVSQPVASAPAPVAPALTAEQIQALVLQSVQAGLAGLNLSALLPSGTPTGRLSIPTEQPPAVRLLADANN